MSMKTFDEALAYLLEQASPIGETETLPLTQLHGRILAEDIISPVNVPPMPVATMDGYAVSAESVAQNSTLPITQRIAAGDQPEALQAGTAARIFTGAAIPQGADAVVMQEETTFDETHHQVTINAPVQAGQNIRATGASIQKGAKVLTVGQKLRPQEVGLMASMGIAQAQAYRRLKVATFTTGEELLEPGQAPEAGKIFNANRYLLSGLISELGLEFIDLGQVSDTLEATQDALKQAASVADVVMTTGGVSVGGEDHVKPAVESLGSLNMWKVKMKPGKPLAYGTVLDKPFIGLPGNPVSAFATFKLFAQPFLRKMQGEQQVVPQPLFVKADFDWRKPGFRREFARGRLRHQGTETWVELFANQDSGVLTSTVWAEGFVVIPEDSTLAKGDTVAFYPF
ncbi:molybdopterin molybdotransferase MoeA [Galenea microaerophila]